MCNSHIVKMSVETLQILYTVLRANGCAWIDKSIAVPKSITKSSKRKRTVTDTTTDTTTDTASVTTSDVASDASDSVIIEYEYVKPYRSTHTKHPCMLWTGACDAHFLWTLAHGIALVNEYSCRFGKCGLCYYHIRHIRDHWRMHGWSSPRDIPSTITPQTWLNSLAPTLRNDNVTRIACLNPPEGCVFGVVCMDSEHRLVVQPEIKSNNQSVVDWTGSYAQFYNYKRNIAFKRPMTWGHNVVQRGGILEL